MATATTQPPPPPPTTTTTTTTTTSSTSTTGTTHARPPPPATATSASVDAVTSDGAVLTLDDGSVYSVDAGDQNTVRSWSSGDPVSVADTGDAITKLSSGEKVSVTSVGNVSDTNVYAATGDHTQMTSSSDGSIIVLDDGSIWIVASADQATTSVWVDASSITVDEGSSGSGSV